MKAFFCWREKHALAEDRNPLQELEELIINFRTQLFFLD